MTWNLARLGLCLGLSFALFGCGRSPQAKEDPAVGGKPLSAWAKQLKDKDPGTRASAAKELAELGAAAKPAVPELVAAIKDCSWELYALDIEGSEQGTMFFSLPASGELGGTPEEREKAKKEAEKRMKEQEKKAEELAKKFKPLEERLKKEESTLLALLTALEKIDPQQADSLGLGDGKLAKMKEALARHRMATTTFEKVGSTIGGPPAKP
jgi:hypothetical protein